MPLPASILATALVLASTAAPEPAGDARDRTRARLDVGYEGASYAPEARWLNGVSLGAGAQFKVPVTLRVGIEVVPRWSTTLRSEPAAVGVTSRVRRLPVSLGVGYHYRRRAFGVDGELRLIADPTRVEVTTIALIEPANDLPTLTQSADTTLLLSISPRIRFHYRPAEVVSLHLGVGIDLQALNREFFVDFLAPGTENRLERVVYLRPNVVRPTLSVGLSFWLP